jgi:hypothetical protein
MPRRTTADSGTAARTGDAWVTEARIARLLADVRKAEAHRR